MKYSANKVTVNSFNFVLSKVLSAKMYLGKVHILQNGPFQSVRLYYM